METEIESKFPNIDVPALRTKLKASGAKQMHPEILMRRQNFDYPDNRLDAVNGWVRVRDEGTQTTLSYKQLNDRTLHGTKEVTVAVDAFEKACSFLRAIGLESKAYQETKREKWLLGQVEVTIDTWPWVPTFVELEGPSEKAVRDASSQLGLDWSSAMHGSVETIYQMHYVFTESEIDHWESITFIDPPAWLLAKKRTN